MIEHVHIDRTTTDGVVRITAAGWEGQIFRLSRNAFIEWQKKGMSFPSTSVAYVLYADHFDKRGGSDLYVGHSEQAEKRWTFHDSDKDYWTAALMFTSVGDWMNAAHTKRIEFEMIQWAEGASRYSVKNGTSGAQGSLGELDKVTVERFLNPVRHILEMVGIDVFTSNPAGKFLCVERDVIERRDLTCTLRVRSFNPPRVEILDGSELTITDEAMKTELIDSGAAKIIGCSAVKFIRDHEMAVDTKSSGVQLILGRLARKWINANQRDLTEAIKVGKSAIEPESVEK